MFTAGSEELKTRKGAIERSMSILERIRAGLFTLLLSRQFAEIGPRALIHPPLRFNNLHQIRLCAGVTIHRDCWLVALGDDEDGRPKLIIKSHAAIGMGATISAAGHVEIGERVLLARNVYISDHGHAFEDIEIPIMDQGITVPKPVSIGNHTWLGQNACILPGVRIGEHCVVGANSVVTSDIPDRSVAVGAPARVVKTFNKSSQRWERI